MQDQANTTPPAADIITFEGALAAAGLPTAPRLRAHAMVRILSHEPIGYVRSAKPDPDVPGEWLYEVATWRNGSELREVCRVR